MTHTAENELSNPTPYLNTLQNPLGNTKTPPGSIPCLDATPYTRESSPEPKCGQQPIRLEHEKLQTLSANQNRASRHPKNPEISR